MDEAVRVRVADAVEDLAREHERAAVQRALAISFVSVRPSTFSITRNRKPASTNTSTAATRFGWSSMRSALASRANRFVHRPPASCRSGRLQRELLAGFVSTSQTPPMPPRPIGATSRYLPSRVPRLNVGVTGGAVHRR